METIIYVPQTVTYCVISMNDCREEIEASIREELFNGDQDVDIRASLDETLDTWTVVMRIWFKESGLVSFTVSFPYETSGYIIKHERGFRFTTELS